VSAPKVSIVMAVYNGGPFLPESVQSVLGQIHRDFEFIIIDDGSIDDTWRVLNQFAEGDRRIVLLRNQPNIGVVRSLNRGLNQSTGEIIVRQDADDISHPERIQKQLAFLDSHPEYGLVAAVPQPVNIDGSPLNLAGWNASSNEDIQIKLLDYMCLCGPSITFRRSCLKEAGFYFSEGLDASEDYDLCLRLAEVTKLASLDGSLYLYRQHPESASSQRAHQQMVNKAIALERAITRRFGQHPPRDKVALVSRDYLHAAIIGFVCKDRDGAQRSLKRAIEVYPPLLDDKQPLERLVRAYTPMHSVDDALEYTASLFEDLLPRTRRLMRMKSRLISYLHMSEVFAGASQNQSWRVDAHLGPGIRHSPAWLFNRGIVSILAKRLVRHKTQKTRA
jgi:glycosyltransferase involved in cell wall biosynthesis